MHERRDLTKDESAHVAKCDACMDAWLTAALDEKPEVTIPADFAARLAAIASPQQKQRVQTTPRPWGLFTAVVMVAVLLTVWFSGPASMNSWVGLLFVMLVSSELAGLALWLGPRWMRR
ncbi:MAG: hypothetical protein JOZ83_10445 [Silvibacterium sp.]|nr:hypothetical protein [Silvibacterium sp.]